MQKVYIMNERLLSILDRWVLFVDKYDVMSNNTMLDGKDRDHYVSNEYLESIQADHIGHPETARSYCIKPPHYKGVDKNYQLEYNILDSEMRTELSILYNQHYHSCTPKMDSLLGILMPMHHHSILYSHGVRRETVTSSTLILSQRTIHGW